MALGAQPSGVLRLVVTQGMTLALDRHRARPRRGVRPDAIDGDAALRRDPDRSR